MGERGLSLQTDMFTAMLVLAAGCASEVFTASFTSTTTKSLLSILTAATEITEAPTPVERPVCEGAYPELLWVDGEWGCHSRARRASRVWLKTAWLAARGTKNLLGRVSCAGDSGWGASAGGTDF